MIAPIIPATPLNNADQGGLFFIGITIMKTYFDKPAMVVDEHLALLIRKGLRIENFQEARHLLQTIGYYRLQFYFHPFQSSTDSFKSEVAFPHILELYNFDRELRLLVSDAIERIEVAFRAAISNTMSIKYDAHWYLNSELFFSSEKHRLFLANLDGSLKQNHEGFIAHYYSNYHSPNYPPSWMIMECLSFGAVSKLYSNIRKRVDRKDIGNILGQYSEIIKSWMKSLTYTRNVCAHHSRLWNRFFVNKPQDVPVYNQATLNASPFYAQAYIINKFMEKIAPKSHWKQKLYQLFEQAKNVPKCEMGFVEQWHDDPFWN